MELNEIRALYEQHERRAVSFPGMRREEDGPVVRLIMEAEDDGASYIPFSALTAENADAVIARQVRYFRDLGRSVEWTVYADDQPPDLVQRLQAQGFEAEDDEGSLLVLDLEDAPSRLLEPPAAAVRQVTDPAEFETGRRLLQEVWGAPYDWFVPRMTRLMKAGVVETFIAEVDGEPASVGWVFVPEDTPFAGLFGGSTLERFRGRGLYTALLAARAQEARRRGFRFLFIDAGDMSRPIAQKNGFRELTKVSAYYLDVSES